MKQIPLESVSRGGKTLPLLPLESVYFEVLFLVSYIRVSPITSERIEDELIGENTRNTDASTNSSAKKIHHGRDSHLLPFIIIITILKKYKIHTFDK